MLVYYDTKTGKRIDSNIDFGSIMPGQSVKESIIIQNEFEHKIELKPYTKDPDLKISKCPQTLEPGKSAILDLEFAPKKDRIVPLNAEFGFELTVG